MSEETNNDHMDTRCWGYKAADGEPGYEGKIFANADEREAAGYVDHPSKIKKPSAPPSIPVKRGKDDDDGKKH